MNSMRSVQSLSDVIKEYERLHDAQKYESAIQYLTRKIPQHPYSGLLYQYRGDLYRAFSKGEGHLWLALADYNKAIDLGKPCYCLRGETYNEMGRFDDAIKDYIRSLKNPKEKYYRRSIANNLYQLLRDQQKIHLIPFALEILMAVEQSPDEQKQHGNTRKLVSHHLLVETIEKTKTKLNYDFDKNLEIINALLHLVKHAPSVISAPIKVLRAEVYSSMGRNVEALLEIDEAIALQPETGSQYFVKGNFLKKLGKFQEAAKEYELALACDKPLLTYYMRLARMLCYDMNDVLKAQFWLEAACRIYQNGVDKDFQALKYEIEKRFAALPPEQKNQKINLWKLLVESKKKFSSEDYVPALKGTETILEHPHLTPLLKKHTLDLQRSLYQKLEDKIGFACCIEELVELFYQYPELTDNELLQFYKEKFQYAIKQFCNDESLLTSKMLFDEVAKRQEELERKEEKQVPLTNKALELSTLGKQAMVESDFYGAIAYFTQALQYSADNADLFFDRGLAYLESKNLEKALSDFNKAIQLSPHQHRMYYQRAVVLEELNQSSEADKDYVTFASLIQNIPLTKNMHLLEDGKAKKLAQQIIAKQREAEEKKLADQVRFEEEQARIKAANAREIKAAANKTRKEQQKKAKKKERREKKKSAKALAVAGQPSQIDKSVEEGLVITASTAAEVKKATVDVVALAPAAAATQLVPVPEQKEEKVEVDDAEQTRPTAVTIDIPVAALDIMRLVEECLGKDILLGGGTPRDILAGIDAKNLNDFDFYTNASGDDIEKLFKRYGIYKEKSIKDFELYRFYIGNYQNRVAVDISCYPKAKSISDLVRLAKQSDLTANSLFVDRDGQVYDYTQRGIRDIKSKETRFVIDPHLSTQNDPIRILRAIITNQRLNASMSDKEKDALKTNAPLLVKQIKPEHLLVFVRKLFTRGQAEANFKTLRELGILPILFPMFKGVNEALLDQCAGGLKKCDKLAKAKKSVVLLYIFADWIRQLKVESVETCCNENPIILVESRKYPERFKEAIAYDPSQLKQAGIYGAYRGANVAVEFAGPKRDLGQARIF